MPRSFWLILLVAGVASPQAFEAKRTGTAVAASSPVEVVAHLPARDGGRFVVSRTASPDLPLEQPFQAVHSGSSLALRANAAGVFVPVEVPGILQVQSLAFGVNNAGTRYALGTGGSFAISRDGGTSWQTFLSNPPAGAASIPGFLPGGRLPRLGELVIDPRDERGIYVRGLLAAGTVVFPASQWNASTGSFGPISGLPLSAAGPFARTNPRELWAAVGATVYRRAQVAGAWEPVGGMPDGVRVIDLQFEGGAAAGIWALSEAGELWRSRDGGMTWQRRYARQNAARDLLDSMQLAVNPSRVGHVAFYSGRESVVSLDGGESFQAAAAPRFSQTSGLGVLNSSPFGIEFDPGVPTILYADGRRRISRDSGRTWSDQQPARVGQQVCSPFDPGLCYAIAERFENFYIEKRSLSGELQWASYWGENLEPREFSASVDRDGVLCLNAGNRVARVLASGLLLDVRSAPVQIQRMQFLGDGAVVAVTLTPEGARRLAVLEGESLSPRPGVEVPLPDAVHDLEVAGNRAAVLSGGRVWIWTVGAGGLQEVLPGERFVARDLAWRNAEELLLAGSAAGDAEVRSWSGAEARTRLRMAGSDEDFFSALTLDPRGRVWLQGSSSSANFPQRWPLENGPARQRAETFVVLVEANLESVRFASFFGGSGPMVAAGDGVAIAQGASFFGFPWGSEVGGLARVVRFFAAADYTQWQFEPVAAPPLEIERVERRVDGSGGDWSQGAWMRVHCPQAQGLPEEAASLGTASTRTDVQGWQVLLDGEAQPILGTVRGVIEVSLSGLRRESKGELQILRAGEASQKVRLRTDPFSFELLPRPEASDFALAYNADGTENSEANPAPLGSQVTLFVVGGLEETSLYLAALDAATDFTSFTQTDYLEPVPNSLPGLRYAGLTLPRTGSESGVRKMALLQNFEYPARLSIWVKP